MKPRYFIWILFLIIHQIVCFEAVAQQEIQQQQDLPFIESSIPVVPGSKGDVDGNGAIEIFDLIRARDISIGRLSNPDESQFFAGDINSDGFIHQDDVENIRDILLQKTVPPPTIFSINPTSGMEGDQITIDGAGFNPTGLANLVTFGGIEATVVSETATTLIVIVPAGAASGDVIVTVGEQSSNSVAFQVTVSQNAPLISDITPESPLRRQEITIEGERFGAVRGNSEVRFGDVEAEDDDIISWSDTQIITKVPSAAFPGIVTVIVDTTVSNGFAYNVVVVESFAPDSSDIIENADGIEYFRNIVILDFQDSTTLEQISAFLSQHDLTQVGLIFHPRMIQARIDDGRDPFEFAESLITDTILEGAYPSTFMHTTTAVSETYPDRILQNYDPSRGTFLTPQTKAWYHHFAMQTYAGHRLAEYILNQFPWSPPRDVAVAVIDAGLGDGSTNYPDEFENRIRWPTLFTAKGGDLIYTTGVVQLIDIYDYRGHGSPVSGLAAGEGIVSLGTGKHVKIRPMKYLWTTPWALACALEIAAWDEEVKVINLSIGSYNTWLPEVINNFFSGMQLKIITKQIDAALNKGKIIVTSAGNENIDTDLSVPATLAPGHHPRSSSDRNILNVAATWPTLPFYEEERPDWSNFGEKVSVSAPGYFLSSYGGGLLGSNYGPTSKRGTSLSAPLVSGLAAEMILIDKAMVKLGRRSVEMSPFQIIQIIEATADDLGDEGFDIFFGNGRINVWKALLAVVNGGVALDNPEWYGFEIRASLAGPSEAVWNHLADNFRAARICIDNQPLTDDSNNSSPAKEISLQKRVPGRINPEDEKNIPLPLNELYVEKTDLMCNFSITSDEITPNGSDLKILQLRKAEEATTYPPLFEMPMDLPMFKLGVPNFVSYENYVFTIKIPRVVEMKSIQNGQTLSLTKNVNGKDITYPIGAHGGRLELSISFPGFVPTTGNTDIQFFSMETVSQTHPENVSDQVGRRMTHKFETNIHDQATTGPVMIRTMPAEFNKVISFSSPDSLIIAKSVGLNLEGIEPGDPVRISIHVPHFDATPSNTKIKFPGNNPEVAPDQVTEGNPPNVTHVLDTTIPENLEEGMVKITITVDNGQQVEFDGGEIVFFERTNYAGTLTLNEFTTPYYNGLPPAGQRTMPVRFTLNKTIENQYFFTASIENWPFAFGPTITAVLDEGLMHFYESWTGEGMTSDVTIRAFPDNDTLNGTWSITLRSGSSIMMYWHADFDAQVETEVGDFNGAFWGRPIRRNEGKGDPELLESLKESTLPAEFFMHYPLAFVQVDQLTALTWVFQQSAGAPSGASDGMQKSVIGQNNNNLASIPDFPSALNNYVVLNYYVGSLDGNRFTFDFDDTGRLAPYYYVDLDPFHNIVTTYDLTKNGDNLTGTITLMREDIDQEETKTATIVFDYSGRLQKEDENDISIIGIVPPPEIGFPTVAGDVVTLTKVTVGYNFIGGTEGTVVLRAFKNNNPSGLLAELELPIQLFINTGGKVTFEDFNIPGVGSDVTTISIFAGLRPAESTTFIVESSVISYSR